MNTDKTKPIQSSESKYQIGQVVRHRLFPFRGIVFDIDSQFNGTEEWLAAIPEAIRPGRDQPFYHLLAEDEPSGMSYIAYASEQNLTADTSGRPIEHPAASQFLDRHEGGYVLGKEHAH